MHKTRFSETQIISVSKSVEAGRTVKDVCRDCRGHLLQLESLIWWHGGV